MYVCALYLSKFILTNIDRSLQTVTYDGTNYIILEQVNLQINTATGSLG